MTKTDAPATTTPSWTEHLGTGVTLGYIALIAVGMFHRILAYRFFGINILDYAEASDFLLAPFHEPAVLVVTILPLVLAWAYLRGVEGYAERQRIKWEASGKPKKGWWRSSDKTNELMKRYWIVPRVPVALYWMYTSANVYQRRQARKIWRGEGALVALELSSGATMQGQPNRPLSLIGTTSRFVFVFRTDEWRTEIIPLDNVLRIVPENAPPARLRDDKVRAYERLDSAGGMPR